MKIGRARFLWFGTRYVIGCHALPWFGMAPRDWPLVGAFPTDNTHREGLLTGNCNKKLTWKKKIASVDLRRCMQLVMARSDVS